MDYAINIDNMYFKDFVYAERSTLGRVSGHSQLAGNYNVGDIIDVKLTDNIEYMTTRRSLAEKIQLIYDIDKFKNKVVSIVPVEE
ncbi:hypothetical protein FDB61_15695 [Clostridium botulinum]|nr:hypothetical protein [Clostridium botulinum]